MDNPFIHCWSADCECPSCVLRDNRRVLFRKTLNRLCMLICQYYFLVCPQICELLWSLAMEAHVCETLKSGT
jgi:hypothetical protein